MKQKWTKAQQAEFRARMGNRTCAMEDLCAYVEPHLAWDPDVERQKSLRRLAQSFAQSFRDDDGDRLMYSFRARPAGTTPAGRAEQVRFGFWDQIEDATILQGMIGNLTKMRDGLDRGLNKLRTRLRSLPQRPDIAPAEAQAVTFHAGASMPAPAKRPEQQSLLGS